MHKRKVVRGEGGGKALKGITTTSIPFYGMGLREILWGDLFLGSYPFSGNPKRSGCNAAKSLNYQLIK